ncbi:hypothetical protein SAMN06297144_3266 [Sphingomonas guangdongensis]|uniref:DUF4398 domain-containing protein n=1 Tax=Sphingomonas guangdongensis TaxID=1141890 RepID=A0A285R205_9SPHN|nr:hypothetical protein [Sphingomonas guangdongensis]SOB88125.1 hypothetical protein SAMN06297144_3266 [Sphingomonas guangdongensis]
MTRINPGLPALLLALSACSGTGAGGPSLLPRAVETRSNAEPVRPAPVATPDAALDAQIAERSHAFDRAADAFERQAAAIGPTITRARGAREGSEAWVAGQVALGELSEARAAVESAAAGLEELAIARESARAAPYTALDTALAAANARVERITAADAALRQPF